ncbi:hypothetical protein HanIR_Chr05g0213421 [Helianthus annuus]|nr:hypothetical protein HanIR_Chr05g0213421 [Helianthus annuus]
MVKKMSSFSGLEIGLGVLFVCILLVLSAELYYLLFWKKRLSKKRVDVENQHIPSSNITHSSYTSCWKTSKSIKTQEKDMQTHIKQQDSDMGLGKDLVLKGLGDESLDLELMRLHNLCGPPRFLFTINEETKEDLESEVSKKGSRTGSFSDILDTLGTPFLSPLASPLKVPQQHNLEAYAYNYNEEKLLKRLMQMEGEKRGILKSVDQDSPRKQEGKDASFVKFVVSKGKSEGGHHLVSTSSKVLPLPCSPTKTTMATIDKKR